MEGGQFGGQVDAGERLDGADGHPSGGQARHRRDRLPGLLGAGQQRAGPRHQRPARLGEYDPAAGAVEQLGAQLPFQVADRRAERRLHDQLPARGGGEAALGDDGHEVAELADLHRPTLEPRSIWEMGRSETICWTAVRSAGQPGGMSRSPSPWTRLVSFLRALARADHHYSGGY